MKETPKGVDKEDNFRMERQEDGSSWSFCGSSATESWQLCGSQSIRTQDDESETMIDEYLDVEEGCPTKGDLHLSYEEYWDRKLRNKKFLRGQERQKRADNVFCISSISISRHDKRDTTDYDDQLPFGSLTLNKKGRWNLPHALEEEATSITMPRPCGRGSRKYGERVVHYEVPVTGIHQSKMSATDKELAQHVRTDPFFAKSVTRWSRFNSDSRHPKGMAERVSFYTLVSLKGFVKPIFHGAFSLETPAELQEDPALVEFLRVRYSAPRGANPECTPFQASTSSYSSVHHFAPDTDKNGTLRTNQFLELDLGASKDVRFFAVAGRVPKTWRTSRTEDDHRVTYNIVDAGVAQKPWYFERYEVYYRVSGGQPWFYLGKFAGPSQNYEEKVQAVDLGGQKCRFLRFVPILSPNDPFPEARGMRVSVYGYDTSSPKKQLKAIQDHGTDDNPTSASITLNAFDGPRWASKRSYPDWKRPRRMSRTSRRRAFANDLKYL